MVEDTRRSLARLGVGVFLVPRDAEVETVLEPRMTAESSDTDE
jgi:hypothetical protein